FANYLARLVFPDRTRDLKITVDLVAEMAVYNPFDFFLEPSAENFPFKYDAELAREVAPYLVKADPDLARVPRFKSLLAGIDRKKRRTVDFLVELNQRVQSEVRYLI